MEHTFNIKGMHCQNCVLKIEAALKALSEIDQVNVSLDPPKAIVKMRSHIDTKVLNEAIKKVGDYSLSESIGNAMPTVSVKSDSAFITYYPLILISAYLIGGVIVRAITSNNFDAAILADNFMGGFFIIFSFFKMLNLRGFAQAYSTYDIVAKKHYNYGFIYPFVELSLGILYLTGSFPLYTNLATVIVMTISSIGVVQSLLRKSKIQCACLGTIFNLPMTKITLFEDTLMAGMALVMLYGH